MFVGRSATSLIAAAQSPILLEGSKTIAGEKGTVSERSFVMIKPDGVSRQLVGKVRSRPADSAELTPDRLAIRGEGVQARCVSASCSTRASGRQSSSWQDQVAHSVACARQGALHRPQGATVLLRPCQVHHLGHPRRRHVSPLWYDHPRSSLAGSGRARTSSDRA